MERHNDCLLMVSGFLYKRQIKPVLQGLIRQSFSERVEIQLLSWRHKGNCLKIKMSALGNTELPIVSSIQVDIGGPIRKVIEHSAFKSWLLLI